LTLTNAPSPLTTQQRAITWIVALLCAASRFLAMARSMWEWDEALFCLGLRSFDVSNHHPHPPGFPVYIGVAKLLRVFIGSDFRALQAINLLAGILLFPAIFMLARELRLRFSTAVIAGALCAFLPNVWFYGGTAFSDVPSITLVVFAVAFLFRGCRDANAYFIGVLLLALAVGIRPQNLLVGLFPGALATWVRGRQSIRDVLLAVILGGATIAVAYGGAIAATGSFAQYRATLAQHAEYITRVDSFRSAERPPLWHLFDRFFIKQYQSSVLSIATSIFVLLSVAGAIRNRDRAMLYNALTFGPFALSAWLMLDRYSINRFSIGYAPMFALFAADGIARACRPERLRGAWRKGGGTNAATPPVPSLTLGMTEIIVGAALIGAFCIWTLPALAPVRDSVAPSVQGVEAVARHLDARRDDLFVGFSMTPFVDYLLPGYPYHRVFDERALPLSAGGRPAYLLAEVEHTQPSGFVFRRDRGRLWNISRRHYFEVALEPIRQLPQFVSGWYPPERGGTEERRWMMARSVTLLPPAGGPSFLRIQFDVPDELMTSAPAVTIALNGAVLDRFRPNEAHLVRQYEVTLPSSGSNVLEMSTERTSKPSGEGRELGLLLRALSWGPV
jgi:hypothetical protein